MGMHVDAPGSKFKLLHLVSSLSEVDRGGGPPRPWQQALLFGWRILKFQCLEHGLKRVDASLGPLTPCPGVSSMQGPGQGLSAVSDTNDDKVLSCRFLPTR